MALPSNEETFACDLARLYDDREVDGFITSRHKVFYSSEIGRLARTKSTTFLAVEQLVLVG